VPWNRFEACKWLNLAAKAGIREAVSALDVFRLPPEERAEGVLTAKRFVAEPEPQNEPTGRAESQTSDSLSPESTQLSLLF
jgi:hypothetical protein